jgi:hypothetical protein
LPKYVSEPKYNASVMSKRALAALEAVLPAGTPVEIAQQLDQDLAVSVAGRTLRLRWLPAGWPRQVAEALRRRPRPDIIAAPQLSPGARELAASERVGWLDESGAAEIHADALLISRSGDARKPLGAKLGWRPATLAVCEVLVAGCPATVSATANETGLAASTVAESLKFLERDGLLHADAERGRQSGRRIADVNSLLDAYAVAAERLRPATSLRVGVLWRDPIKGAIEVGRSWLTADIRWAVTSALSAAAMSPVLTEVVPMEIYVTGRTPGDLRRAAAAAGLREIDGGRLVIRPFPTPAADTVAEQLRPGLISMLWPRAYADLRVAGVRGEDAAEHLRAEMSRD